MQAGLEEAYANRGKLGHWLDFPAMEKLCKVVLDGSDCYSLVEDDGETWLTNGEDLLLKEQPNLPPPPLSLAPWAYLCSSCQEWCNMFVDPRT